MSLQHMSLVTFDPNNPSHRQAYLNFLNTGKWSIRFRIEHPFKSVPGMCMFRLAEFACKAEGAVDQKRIYSDNAPISSDWVSPPRLVAVK